MYKKFGEIYNEKYNGWLISRYYVNPVAEYSFRKAVSLGWINEVSLDDSLVTRERRDKSMRYMDVDKTWDELNNKLPNNVKGPETWAKKKVF
ncbi:hypothetical protein D3C75_811520 [compost metagenome]